MVDMYPEDAPLRGTNYWAQANALYREEHDDDE
jgi:hypothetical protein